MKQNLDERQNQEIAKTGSLSFVVMFIVCVLVILFQLVFQNSSIKGVLGETVVLLAGGCTYLTGAVKNGSFDMSLPEKGKKYKIEMNIIESILISAIFSAFYGWIVFQRASEKAVVGKYVALFFIGITILCFGVLTVMDVFSRNSRKKEEKKYDGE